MNIVKLEAKHLEEACTVFIKSYYEQKNLAPVLDEQNAESERILSLLNWCLQKHPGVAAIKDGKLIAYMTGFYMDTFQGVHKGVFCPEWAHSSKDENAFNVYRLLYQCIGQQWVDSGCLTHAINFMAYAQDAQAAFCWNGFGNICMDAVRPIEPIIINREEDIHITVIQEKDVPVLASLIDALNRHIAKSPAFKSYLERETQEELMQMIKSPANCGWIAWNKNEPMGFMKVSSHVEGASWMVDGKNKFAIDGAYVNPEYRGSGIGKLLLSTIMEWGKEEGFKWCSVDFEATNLEASEFWLKYFQPVCLSMIRRLDERILHTI